MELHRASASRAPSPRPIVRALGEDERGFTIVESVVAMILVVILFVGVAVTLQLSIRHQRQLRLQQQGTALAQDYVEASRALTWSELALDAAPPGSVPNVVAGDVLATPFNLPTDETLYVDATNGLVTAAGVGAETINGQVFDIYQYVSTIETGLRRFIVLVEWESRGLDHSYFTTTQISELGAG